MSELAVVTGAGGFVGGALVRALCERGCQVRAIVRSGNADLNSLPIEIVNADLATANVHELRQAFSGAAVVFHTAAKVDMWGAYEEFYLNNVVGTQNVITACRSAGVKYLIFTSSPSVVANGRNLSGIDEQYPYPEHFEAYYPKTKALAEQNVLAAQSSTLRVIALRPHLIWGPGDRHLVPTILERARRGRLVCIGNGQNKVDVCFIDDCVYAHLCAWDALRDGRAAGGKAYFISQGEPVLLWEWINQILAYNGLPAVTRRIPTRLALTVATLLEGGCKLLPWNPEPVITRFLVSEMATDHYFKLDAANRDLGFVPQWSIQDALNATFTSPERLVQMAGVKPPAREI